MTISRAQTQPASSRPEKAPGSPAAYSRQAWMASRSPKRWHAALWTAPYLHEPERTGSNPDATHREPPLAHLKVALTLVAIFFGAALLTGCNEKKNDMQHDL